MRFSIIFVVTCCLVACLATRSSAFPAAGDDSKFVDGLDDLKHLEPELHSRHKRATCDLLSYFGVNNSACAAHCVLLGNRGGYCSSKAVCICRK